MKQAFLSVNHQINPYSLLVTVAFDFLWNIPDLFGVGLCLAPVIFLLCFGTVTLIQRHISQDDLNTAMTKGLLLGVLAALPFSVITTTASILFGVLQLRYGADQDVMLLGELTKAWKNLEHVLKSPFSPAEQRAMNLDETIDALFERGLISAAEQSELHMLRMARNKIVHNSQQQEVSIAELSELVGKVKQFSANLGRRLQA